MEQELQKRYRVLFIDSDFERYFEHSWDAVKYAALNNGIVYDQDADRIIASYAKEGDERMTTSEALNRMAAITSAQSKIARYNDDLDKYVTNDLVKIYADHGISVIDGRISGGNVLRAASLYNKYVRDNFGLRAAFIIYDMCDRGYDVRLDMNSYKLIWKGVYNNG